LFVVIGLLNVAPWFKTERPKGRRDEHAETIFRQSVLQAKMDFLKDVVEGKLPTLPSQLVSIVKCMSPECYPELFNKPADLNNDNSFLQMILDAAALQEPESNINEIFRTQYTPVLRAYSELNQLSSVQDANRKLQVNHFYHIFHSKYSSF
jgi:hypothetical protein